LCFLGLKNWKFYAENFNVKIFEIG